MEIAATEILAFEPNQVPDLLQTPEYARALADADANCDLRRAARARDRGEAGPAAGRARRAGRPALEVVITEGALRQAVGGPRVMREQLGRLAAVADAGRVTGLPDGDGVTADGSARISLQVLPFAAGAHAAAGCGPMTILRFAQTPEIGVVHLAGLSGGVSLEGAAEVARYLRTFAQLRSAALARGGSARLLRAIGRGSDAAVTRLSAGRVGGLGWSPAP